MRHCETKVDFAAGACHKLGLKLPQLSKLFTSLRARTDGRKHLRIYERAHCTLIAIIARVDLRCKYNYNYSRVVLL